MATENLNIFLSASIPDPKRNPIYWETADLIAIRDSVRALATVVLPRATLVWGGHPAITPLIRIVAESIGASVQEHVILYQSRYFLDRFPKDNKAFEKVIVTPTGTDRETSLEIMRTTMIKENQLNAGIFIGGMEGVEEEFDIFRKFHADAPFYPIASTGAAARVIFDKYCLNCMPELSTDFAYNSLFLRILQQIEFNKLEERN